MLNASNGRAAINNPYRTFTNYIYPKNMQHVFIWAQWFWNRNHKYRTSIDKVVSYFVSSLDITAQEEQGEGPDNDAIKAARQVLQDTYDMQQLTVQFGQQLAAMGNCFVSAQRIFTRDLLCPTEGCNAVYNLHRMVQGKDYRWHGGDFSGHCKQCNRDVTFKVKDTPCADPSGRKIRFIFRSAKSMRLKFNQLTGQYKFLYALPGSIKNGILRGDSVYLQTTPMLYIKAAIKNQLIEFPQDSFFHMRTHTLSQLDQLYQGWGVPIFLASFGNLVRLAMLDRFNEAVVMQYIAPVRMISPPPDLLKGGSDPSRSPVSGAAFRNIISQAVAGNSYNPTQWIISPFPAQYQMLGGQAKQMAPVQLMQWYVGQILSDMGIPQQFRQTSFQVVAPSMGLRMFQRMWIHFAKDLNKFVRWASDRICETHNISHMNVKLNMTSFVQDDMNKQIKLNLAGSGLISKQEALQVIGIDYERDRKRRLEEQREQMQDSMLQDNSIQGVQMVSSVLPPPGSVGVQSAQMALQQAQQAAMGDAPASPQGGGAPMPPAGPGGAPGQMPYGTGNSQNATMDMLYQQAQQEAQRIFQVGRTSGSGARRSQLVRLKSNNPQLHAQVKAILQNMDQQTASQAVQQSKMPG